LVSFANATKGFPGGVAGNLGRMFYLSAVTITTLGLGDIVPLTNTTRLLVASEAMIGILLAGPFSPFFDPAVGAKVEGNEEGRLLSGVATEDEDMDETFKN